MGTPPKRRLSLSLTWIILGEEIINVSLDLLEDLGEKHIFIVVNTVLYAVFVVDSVYWLELGTRLTLVVLHSLSSLVHEIEQRLELLL